MKKSDLFREWARVIDLCEGTKVKPWECLKIDNKVLFRQEYVEKYFDNDFVIEFTLAIVEDRPVFQGSVLYSRLTGQEHKVENDGINFLGLSWSKPKSKTVMVELLREDAEEILNSNRICAYYVSPLMSRVGYACKKALG